MKKYSFCPNCQIGLNSREMQLGFCQNCRHDWTDEEEEDDDLDGDDFISCIGCDMECTDIETMESDDDANWFCAECWPELSPGMRKDYEDLKAKGEID